MNCIYTVFYNNLKSYDGEDSNKENRLKLLNYCINSYKKFNPNIQFIIDYVDEHIENTADMYFDKMVRIKNLNYNYNVLWVDADTICLGNLDELFLGKKIKGRYWGHWDNLNLINGGIIYYPIRSLYNNFDFFSKEWISMFSQQRFLNNSNFIGPCEQIPITNLILKQLNLVCDCETYNIHDNIDKLLSEDCILDYRYNINPIGMNRADCRTINSKNIDISQLKILHLNGSATSLYNEYFYILQYLFDENLINYINNKEIYLQKCQELGLLNNIEFELKNNKLFIQNNSNSYIHVIVLDNYDNFTTSSELRYMLHPRQWIQWDLGSFGFYKALIYINIITGEYEIINLQDHEQTTTT
jgi:disulfide oxidoreductase YuzD